MQEVWVMKQTVLRARDQRGLERSLHSFENALRLRDGAIVDVERSEMEPRHVAVIRYEIPLPAPLPVGAAAKSGAAVR